VEVKPYVLDDQMCDECQGARCGGKFAPFFCANVTCLQYYCEHCWATIHSRPGREFHKPLVKEGADRPRTDKHEPAAIGGRVGRPTGPPASTVCRTATKCRHNVTNFSASRPNLSPKHVQRFAVFRIMSKPPSAQSCAHEAAPP
ncbi:cytoplasmic polyadenylation element-binding protein 2 isoform X3, partial [Tropilaelaps mercedesae]